ncbi:DUF952 domain-containing protein, partial [Streptomyces cyaneofuscatus]
MTEPLLHLAEAPLWEAARGTGTYEMSTRGRTLQEEGFIHLSLPHQLPSVARMLYGDGDGDGDGGEAGCARLVPVGRGGGPPPARPTRRGGALRAR